MDVGGKFTATLSNLSISMYSQCQGACCWGHDDDIQNMQNMQYITQWLYTEYAIYAIYNMMMNIKYTIYAIYTMVTMIFIQCSSVCVFMSLKSDPPYCCWYININYQSKKKWKWKLCLFSHHISVGSWLNLKFDLGLIHVHTNVNLI